MLLIGAGGNGSSTTGGGSGAVTVWYGAAQNVPNSLLVAAPSTSAINTSVAARFSNSAAFPSNLGQGLLLTANCGTTTTGGTAMTANTFTASGFFQSVAGQDGFPNGAQTASGTTFLSGGSGGANTVTANYGYQTNNGSDAGFFMLQPLIVGVGGSFNLKGGIGCGGGGGGSGNTGLGGSGMVLIASW